MDFTPLWGTTERPTERDFPPEYNGMTLRQLDQIAPKAADRIRARQGWPPRHAEQEEHQEQAEPKPPRQRRAPRSEQAEPKPPKQRTPVTTPVKATPAGAAKKAAPKKVTEKVPGGTDPLALNPVRKAAKAVAKKTAGRPKRGK